MGNDVNYSPTHPDEAAQCRNCKQFQSQDGKSACVPPGQEFEAALAEYGEISPTGHCDYFEAK